MNSGNTSKVVDINCKRHKLPIDVILFHMVDFKKIHSLPVNQDCTEFLIEACQRALFRMFQTTEVYVESFMPRSREFQVILNEEIVELRKSDLNPVISGFMPKIQKLNDNTSHLA